MKETKKLYIITTELSDGRKQQPMYLTDEEYQLLNYDRIEFDRTILQAFYYVGTKQK